MAYGMGNVLSRRRRYKEAIEYYEKILASKKTGSIHVSSSSDGHIHHQEIFEALMDLGKENRKEDALHVACSTSWSCRQPVFTVEVSLKTLIARKDKVYVASHVIDVSHLMGVLLCRLGMLDIASEML